MKRIFTAALAVAMLAGCATRGAGFTPMVDMQGKNEFVFRTDLGNCQDYAKKTADAAAGAMAGAIVVGLLGAMLAPRGYRNEVAGRGAVIGAAGGANQASMSQENIIRRCLAGRGYNVLN